MQKLRIRTSLMAGLAATSLLYLTSGVGADGGHNRFKARLAGFNEVPAISSTGSGEWSGRIRGDSVEWELSYEGLEGTVTGASHIHFGQKDVNGGVSVFFCGGGTPPTPPCTPGSGHFSGTFTAADMGAGTTAQGIAPGEFSELIAAIRAGKTYVNVHTNKHGGGEIRGQVGRDHDDDDDDDDN